MNRIQRAPLVSALCTALMAASFAATAGCALTSHPETAATLGARSSASSLESVVDQPGPVVVETVIGATWEVPLSGLLNLEHPAAKAAKLTDRPEPIVVAFHAIHHPTRGTFLVDTGVEAAIFDAPYDAALTGLVGDVMHVEKMGRQMDTKTWIARQRRPVAGVFLTHMHPDHVSGLRDVGAGTPVFVGPGESKERNFTNLFLAPVMNSALEGKPALSVWQFERDPDGVFEGVIDIFGDRTTWALSVPGHTPGSTAFVVRTPSGPVLITGDACHTSFGWANGVEPGTFSEDYPRSADSLARLRRFAAKHPSLDVRLGHQGLETKTAQR